MHAALQEDVAVVGVSLLSAAHMTVMPEILRIRADLGIDEIPVILGGIVPIGEHASLKRMGIAAVFNPGSSVDKIIQTIFGLAEDREAPSVSHLVEGYANRDVRSLAKLITTIGRAGNMDGWTAPSGNAVRIGVTGAPGVGKSSFIGKLGRKLCDRGKKVAVLAIDPSSPLTGGALLGDRLRMMVGEPGGDFFIRSLSSGGESGGLSVDCAAVLDLLNGFGFDFILVETVGAGQADVAVRTLTDRTMLLLMPESGDAVQFSKAGIMEIADCFVLNKCDLQGADATRAQLLSAVGTDRPTWKVSAIRDEGFDPVVDWIMS